MIARVAALAIAVLALACSEAALGPAEAFARSPASFLYVAALCVWFALVSLPSALTAALASAAVSPTRARLALHALPAAIVSIGAHHTIARDEALRRSPVVWVAFVAAFLALFAVDVLVLRVPRARTPLALALLAAFVVLTAANHTLLQEQYAPVHLAALELALYVLFVALRLTLERGAARTSARAGAAGAALIVVGALAAQRAPPHVLSLTKQYVVLGQAQLALHPFSERAERASGHARFERDGLAHVLRASAFPDVPFDLDALNVLLVSSEAMRFDQTSLADEAHGVTPRLLALARSPGAYTFTHASSPANATLPSNASLLAMTWPSAVHLTTWAKSWCGELRDEETTVPELFHAAGRATLRISHDYHHLFTANVLGLGQGFAVQRTFAEELERDTADVDHAIALAARDEILAQVRASPEQRFFAWVYFGSPHEPYFVHDASAPHDTFVDRYRQEVRFVDDQLAVLLDALDAAGVLANTIVVFLADHGEELLDHGGRGHRALYDECVHVPFVVRVPGAAGGTIDDDTSTLYLFPWLLAHAHGALHDAAERRAQQQLAPMLDATHGAVLTELLGHDKMLSGLVTRDRKVLLDWGAGTTRVFDRARDPGEHHDLTLTDPDAAAAMQPLVDAYRDVRGDLRRYRIEPTRMPDFSLRVHEKRKHKKKQRR